MTELELEQAILDFIKTNYEANYTGYLKVEKFPSTFAGFAGNPNDNPGPGYRMSIGIPHYLFPTTIACDFETDEDFLNYIYSELKTRNYMRVYFYKVIRTPESREQ